MKFFNKLNILGVFIFILSFLFYNELINIDERLFDVTMLIGLLIFLTKKTDFGSVLLSVFISFKLWDEASKDDGLIDFVDYIEIVLIIIITSVNLKKWN